MTVKCKECGKKWVSQEAMEAHADREHPDWRTPKARGWVTPHGFADFREPVTYEEACAATKAVAGALQGDRHD